jgi:hypothetical protein
LSAILLQNNIATDNWVFYLPFTQPIINDTPHQAIGMSPAELLFANNIQLDTIFCSRGIFLPSISEAQVLSVNDWIKEMYNRQENLLEVAQKIQQNIRTQRQQKFEKQHQQKSNNVKDIKIDDFILHKNQNKKDKLQCN